MEYSFYEDLIFSTFGLLALCWLLTKKNLYASFLLSLEAFGLAIYFLVWDSSVLVAAFIIGFLVLLLLISEKYFSCLIFVQEKYNFLLNFILAISLTYLFFNTDISIRLEKISLSQIALESDFFSLTIVIFAMLCIPFSSLCLLKNDKKSLGEMAS